MKTHTFKKQFILLLFTFHFSLFTIFAQNVGINSTGAKPNSSAWLDISDSGSAIHKGMLIPRMTTTQRGSITPAQSLIIYNTTDSCLEIYAGTAWHSIWCTSSPCLLPGSVMASASPAAICAGSTFTLTGNATGGTIWRWTGPNGFTSSLQNPAITGITSADAGTYTLTASNSCGSAAPVTTSPVTVTATIPTAVTAIVSPNPICAGNTLNLSGSATGATTWSWTGPVSITNSSSQNATVPNITTSGAGTYTLTASNLCGPAAPVTTASVTVSATIPTAVTATVSPNPICAGNTLNLSGSATGATTWSWTGPVSITNSSSQNATVPNIIISGAGTYTLTATNICGPAAVYTASVTVNTTPSAPAAPSGNTSPSTGTAYTYTIAAVTGATGYTWSVSTTNGSVTGGQNTTSATITFSGTAGAMSICVYASNACGNSASSCLSVTSSSCSHGTAPFNYTGTIQTWQVPACISSITITADGATGGQDIGYGNPGGLGAQLISPAISVTSGHTINILVGQEGIGSNTYAGGSGGGGTYIWDATSNTLLVVAGGGGGGGGYTTAGGNGGPGQINTATLNTPTNNSVGTDNAAGGSGGNGGSGGSGGSLDAGGGAGWNSNGGNSSGNYTAGGGADPANGGAGGTAGTSGVGSVGGYGGGGGCADSGGGGGGYNGGGGGIGPSSGPYYAGGGGGSYCITGTPNTSAAPSGNGSVTIQY